MFHPNKYEYRYTIQHYWQCIADQTTTDNICLILQFALFAHRERAWLLSVLSTGRPLLFRWCEIQGRGCWREGGGSLHHTAVVGTVWPRWPGRQHCQHRDIASSGDTAVNSNDSNDSDPGNYHKYTRVCDLNWWQLV